ncbi:hypothetical protein AEAC466_02205 [Asticcacaulis sp. AC466]|uniref:DUF4262 domain-containing protein n=1 Tax=Asticcacaulis sp. AC466 TaxID=1282362 RepID=UPI0003C3B869|nr:DUF4262 domain-containing protein [Asticcacaulis sp. AC466]ESQ86020.1 hypothetical protein AEAC466_02205 [Asticcacaulis sp. AC466]
MTSNSKPVIWTALDADDREFTPAARDFVGAIRAHGWTGHDDHDCSYSIGFQRALGVPEIAITGLDAGTARVVLRDAWRLMGSGKRYKIGVPYGDFLHDCRVVFQPVAKRHFESQLGWARWFYAGDDFDCWQMVLPDGDGHFPWEGGYDDSETQADLSEGGWSGRVL